MRKSIYKKIVYIGIIVIFAALVLSCEEDFTDLGSNVISNTKFDTDEITYDIEVENSSLEKVQSDNISRILGQYLLGVFNPNDYEKLEASIVSQLAISTNLKVVANSYGNDTTVVTKIDTVFLKLPYQVSLDDTSSTEYELDSVIGDPTKPFILNVFRSNTFINNFDPSDPTQVNSYQSNVVFEKLGDNLNSTKDFEFLPSKNDTLFEIKRRLFDDSVAKKDTLKLFASTTSQIPVPFARIPLDETKIKELFLDKYETAEFSTQNLFNNYFRGIILEATGNEGTLVSFDFNNAALRPSIEVYYTNTVLKSGTTVLDTIYKNDTFLLNGFRVNTYSMNNKTYPVNNNIIIQGTAGSEGRITLLDQSKINDIRSKNWLITDASLNFYIDQSSDTTNIPSRLYMYKDNNDAVNPIISQIKDAYSESASGGIGGELVRDESGKAERYEFKITDYISDLISGESNYSPNLKLKVFNSSDLPNFSSDTIFRNFSWNPRVVTLFNNSSANGDKKAVLKISYSVKK